MSEPDPRLRLGFWNAYFLGKWALFAYGTLHVWLPGNVLLLLWVCWQPQHRSIRRLRNVVALPAAVLLLYRESWLAAPDELWSQVTLLSQFEFGYLMELAARLAVPVLWTIAALCALLLIKRWLRLEPWVFIGLAVVAWLQWQPQSDQNANQLALNLPITESADLPPPDQWLEQFLAEESTRQVSLQLNGGPPFDLMVLQLCSISNDDLVLTGLDTHPLWARFQWRFSHFNSAASYSGPAAIRLLRGPCGQPSHNDLYDPVPGSCLLYSTLAQSGYRPHLLLNHDGKFGGFLNAVRGNGLAVRAEPTRGVQPVMHQFDGSPVWPDGELLAGWWAHRQRSVAEPVALFYNSVSLHDGNRLLDQPRRDSSETYAQRQKSLLDDLNDFLKTVENSGRATVIVVVAEHGSGLRGDAHQIAGMREIPTPEITQVPAMVFASGLPLSHEAAITIDQATSYLALSELIQRLLRHDYDREPLDPEAVARDLPSTAAVSENAGIAVIDYAGEPLFRDGSGRWKRLNTGDAD